MSGGETVSGFHFGPRIASFVHFLLCFSPPVGPTFDKVDRYYLGNARNTFARNGFLLCSFVRNSSGPSASSFLSSSVQRCSPLLAEGERKGGHPAVSLRIVVRSCTRGGEQTENEDTSFKGVLFGTLPNVFNRNKEISRFLELR